MAVPVFVQKERSSMYFSGHDFYEKLKEYYDKELAGLEGKLASEMIKAFGFDIYSALKTYIVNYCGLDWNKCKVLFAEMWAARQVLHEGLLNQKPDNLRDKEELIEYVYGIRKPPYREAFNACLKQLKDAVARAAAARHTYPLCVLLDTYQAKFFWREYVLKPLFPLEEKLPLVKHRVFAAAVYGELALKIVVPMLAGEYEFRNGVGSTMYI